MPEIGRRIYFDTRNGNVILDTGERSGDVTETAVEEDFVTYKELSARIPETVGYIDLEYGQYSEDFARCNGYRVDPETQQILFSNPDPNEPEQPPVYRPPLTEEVTALNEQIATLLIDSAAKDIRLQQQDAIIADLMLQVATLQTASGGGGA
ncbi:hypothetical protein PACILC2_22190 [Paenibacillus cisolokensis]|uniref:Bacteriophage SP-beta YorD domain-containing protein n=1 Tax=Paenibacillus cisolokensis TaxID=1658519 RepID=A0ABQ4N670_9BACL|nr:hypothetical protein [Paenibacillus cisolokensis]GIQ63651.1 hypothetical protein PACILC2_22190 [Paenibacillus cisolokensis]